MLTCLSCLGCIFIEITGQNFNLNLVLNLYSSSSSESKDLYHVITELVWCLLRSRFKCRHATLLWEERWVRDDPKIDCKGDYHCQGNGLLFRFISILGILTQSSSEIKKTKSVLKSRRWISIKNYNSVFFWISFFFRIIRKLEKRICIALIFILRVQDRCSQQHSGFPLAYIPSSRLPLPPPPQKKKRERKKEREKERKKEMNEGRKEGKEIQGRISRCWSPLLDFMCFITNRKSGFRNLNPDFPMESILKVML